MKICFAVVANAQGNHFAFQNSKFDIFEFFWHIQNYLAIWLCMTFFKCWRKYPFWNGLWPNLAFKFSGPGNPGIAWVAEDGRIEVVWDKLDKGGEFRGGGGPGPGGVGREG